MKEKLKKENGITIVALIITIIILLILVGVSLKTIISDNGTIKSIERGASTFEIEEDKDIISEIRKNVSIKHLGEVPLDNLAETLDERKFTPFTEVKEFNGNPINEDELVVGCPHGDHTYLVTGDGIKALVFNEKDFPIITIDNYIFTPDYEGTGESIAKFNITIECENGLKSITLPNGKTIDNLTEGNIKTSNISEVKITGSRSN